MAAAHENKWGYMFQEGVVVRVVSLPEKPVVPWRRKVGTSRREREWMLVARLATLESEGDDFFVRYPGWRNTSLKQGVNGIGVLKRRI